MFLPEHESSESDGSHEQTPMVHRARVKTQIWKQPSFSGNDPDLESPSFRGQSLVQTNDQRAKLRWEMTTSPSSSNLFGL